VRTAPTLRARLARTLVALAVAGGLSVLGSGSAQAQQWIFTPSIGLDQRFDDNYRLEPAAERQISATRLVGDLGLLRETPVFSISGTARADLRLELGDVEDSSPDSNQILLFDLERRFQRSSVKLDLGYQQDTPSRDISADITDAGSNAEDGGVVTQDSDVARERLDLSPSVRYQLSRRTSVEASIGYTRVDHDQPSPADAIFTQYVRLLQNPNLTDEQREDLTDENGDALDPDQVTIDTVGVFRPTGELDDYDRTRLDLGYRFRLDRISVVSAFAGISEFVSEVDADNAAFVFEDLVPDPDERQILRAPKRESVARTASFRLGYDRELTRTLDIGVQAGLYTNETDDTDTLRRSDGSFAEASEAGVARADLDSSEQGWLANLTLRKDDDRTRYTARFAVDVLPSSAGAQVETQELTGEVFRRLSPLLDFSLRGRAYEPDRLGAKQDDRFARRFISLEPKLSWRFTRAWTAAAAYRYRRQKARVDTEPSQSNAILLSLRYTPPSQIRDLAGR